MTDTLPPHSPPIEKAVLGCLLTCRSCAQEIEGITPRHFYDLKHQEILRAIQSLQRENIGVDVTTVFERLRNLSKAEGIGGLGYLVSLEGVPSMFTHYRTQLDELLQRRQIMQVGEQMISSAQNETLPIEVLASDIESAVAAIVSTGAKTVSVDDRLWFDPQKPPPDEPVLITIAETPCATPGNMSTVTAQKKNGKSAFFSAIISAGISERGDNLGVKAFNPERKTVLHFDTEQSAMDHWKLCDSVLRRARLTESAIFKSVCLTSIPIIKRREIVHQFIRQEAERNGVFIAVIDGHGDLVRNVNDPEETADYVAGLHALAIETHCHIYGALHLNPGSEFKSRGHLGSELERKSQTNLRLEKTDEVFCAWGTENRGAPIPKNVGPCFVWSNDARMHVSIDSRQQSKSEILLDDARMKISEAYRVTGKGALHYSELIAAILKVPGVNSSSTSERIFRAGKECRHIAKNLLNQWHLTQ